MAPEVNAWVVIQPDDTVVIRIARSEMGQGTLTGLAQLVAEELECDWSKVTTEYPTPGQNLARNRVWGRLLDRRQPRHPRVARVRPQGRRGGARDADPGGGERLGRAGRRVQRREERHHACAVGPHDHATARSRRRRRSSSRPKDVHAQGPEGLDDRRQAAEAARHGRQAHRQADLRHRPQAAGHAERRDQGLPGLRRQGARASTPPRSRRMPGVQEGGAGRRHRRSRWSPTPGGGPRPRSTRCRSSGTRARTRTSRARASPRC